MADNQPVQIPNLQTRLMDAIPELTGGDFSYHATDLYLVWSQEVQDWLKANYEFCSSIRSFVSQRGSLWNGQGRRCLDIPFAGYWPPK